MAKCEHDRVDGWARCEDCRRADRDKARAKRAARYAAGMCGQCGRKPPSEGGASCPDCLAATTRRVRALHSRRAGRELCGRCGEAPPLGETPFCATSYCASCRDRARTWLASKKVECFAAYGGSACACCGETELDFLCLDHIEENGAEKRRAGERMGRELYRDLKKAGYPAGYQVLCFNCNSSKHFGGGVCAHVRSRAAIGT